MKSFKKEKIKELNILAYKKFKLILIIMKIPEITIILVVILQAIIIHSIFATLKFSV